MLLTSRIKRTEIGCGCVWTETLQLPDGVVLVRSSKKKGQKGQGNFRVQLDGLMKRVWMAEQR